MKKLLCAAAALLALSCFFDDPTEPVVEEPPEATSPANVLKCVELSFNRRNVAIRRGLTSLPRPIVISQPFKDGCTFLLIQVRFILGVPYLAHHQD